MANLIEYIQSQVYENSTEDISGSIMQQVLTRMASDEGVVNVHTISGQTPFADYNNAQAARDAVPAGFKKLGLIITYKLSSGWYVDEFIGSATSGWSTSSNWKCLGPISVSQNASTGKTTITIGSESFDVATQPVSVSQNTSTRDYQFQIGNDLNVSLPNADKVDIIASVIGELSCEYSFNSRSNYFIPNIGMKVGDELEVNLTENTASSYVQVYLVPESSTSPSINLQMNWSVGQTGKKTSTLTTFIKDGVSLTRILILANDNTCAGTATLKRSGDANSLSERMKNAEQDIDELDQDIDELDQEVNVLKEIDANTRLNAIESVVDVRSENYSFNSRSNYFIPNIGMQYGDELEVNITQNTATSYVQVYLVPESSTSPFINLQMSWSAGQTGKKTATLTTFIQDGVPLTRILILSNDNTCVGTATLTRKKLDTLPNTIMVGKGLGFQFSEIQDAIDSITDDAQDKRYTILVYPGIYSRVSMWDNELRVRYLSIIGTDKLLCIITDNTGNYDTPPFEAYMDGTVENMSFIMKTDSEHYSPREDRQYAYAMHSDRLGARTTLFRNCYFESNAGPAIGIGTHNNVALLFEYCEFTRVNCVGADLGAVFAHTGANEGSGQKMIFRNCNAVNLVGSSSNGLRLRKIDDTIEGNYEIIVQKCGSFNTTQASAYNDATLSYQCWGNNCSNLNA